MLGLTPALTNPYRAHGALQLLVTFGNIEAEAEICMTACSRGGVDYCGDEFVCHCPPRISGRARMTTGGSLVPSAAHTHTPDNRNHQLLVIPPELLSGDDQAILDEI